MWHHPLPKVQGQKALRKRHVVEPLLRELDVKISDRQKCRRVTLAVRARTDLKDGSLEAFEPGRVEEPEIQILVEFERFLPAVQKMQMPPQWPIMIPLAATASRLRSMDRAIVPLHPPV